MAVGILAALYWRGVSGEGQALDVATAEAYACFDDYAWIWYQGTGIVNEHIYLKYMGFGPSRLKKLKEANII
jgi:crotonobetainyl-CoA:carnitine CoA-transferase CaiB-like acyl-CoA transferase